MLVRPMFLHRMALVSVRLFCKNLGDLQEFFGQMVYRPPLQSFAKNCPYAYANGTFWLHRPDISHRAFGYCSCKKDTRAVLEMERDISVAPTDITGSKWTTFTAGPEYSGRTQTNQTVALDVPTEISRILG